MRNRLHIGRGRTKNRIARRGRLIVGGAGALGFYGGANEQPVFTDSAVSPFPAALPACRCQGRNIAFDQFDNRPLVPGHAWPCM